MPSILSYIKALQEGGDLDPPTTRADNTRVASSRRPLPFDSSLTFSGQEADLLRNLVGDYRYNVGKIKGQEFDSILGRYFNDQIELDPQRKEDTLGHELIHDIHQNIGTEEMSRIADSLGQKYGENIPSRWGDYGSLFSDKPYPKREHEKLAFMIQGHMDEAIAGEGPAAFGKSEDPFDPRAKDSLRYDISKAMLQEGLPERREGRGTDIMQEIQRQSINRRTEGHSVESRPIHQDLDSNMNAQGGMVPYRSYQSLPANQRNKLFLGGVTDAIGDAATWVGDQAKSAAQNEWVQTIGGGLAGGPLVGALLNDTARGALGDAATAAGDFVKENPKLTGTLAGAAAAPFTGGLSLAAGTSIGGTAGGLASAIPGVGKSPKGRQRRGMMPPQMRRGRVGTPGYVGSGARGSYSAKGGALKLSGRGHESGGIKLSGNTEVEGGETIGQAQGGKHAFSKRLKVPGKDKTFAQMHQELVERGASQDRINKLAQLQHRVAGRDESEMAQAGGPVDDEPQKELPAQARNRGIPNPVGRESIGMTGATQWPGRGILGDIQGELTEEGNKIYSALEPYLNKASETAQAAEDRASSLVNRLIGGENAYGGQVTEEDMNHLDSGGDINIKDSKKGTFTAAAKKRGMGVQEFARKVMNNKDQYSSAMVKKANFAKNAKKWNNADGGRLDVGGNRRSVPANQLPDSVAPSTGFNLNPAQRLTSKKAGGGQLAMQFLPQIMSMMGGGGRGGQQQQNPMSMLTGSVPGQLMSQLGVGFEEGGQLQDGGPIDDPVKPDVNLPNMPFESSEPTDDTPVKTHDTSVSMGRLLGAGVRDPRSIARKISSRTEEFTQNRQESAPKTIDPVKGDLSKEKYRKRRKAEMEKRRTGTHSDWFNVAGDQTWEYKWEDGQLYTRHKGKDEKLKVDLDKVDEDHAVFGKRPSITSGVKRKNRQDGGPLSIGFTDEVGNAGVGPPVDLPNMPFQSSDGGEDSLPINMTMQLVGQTPPNQAVGPLANRLLAPPSPEVPLVSPDNQVLGSNPSFSGSLSLSSGQADPSGQTSTQSGSSVESTTPSPYSGESAWENRTGQGALAAGVESTTNSSSSTDTQVSGNSSGGGQGFLSQAAGVADQVLPYLPGAINAARGAFGDAEGVSIPRINIPDRGVEAARNMETDINVRPQIGAANQAFRSIVADPNTSEARKQSAFTKLMQQRAGIRSQEQNQEAKLKNQRQQTLARLMGQQDRAEAEANQQAATREALSQQKAEAAKQNLLSSGITQMSRARQRQKAAQQGMNRNIMGLLASMAGAPETVREDVLQSILPLIQDDQTRNALQSSLGS